MEEQCVVLDTNLGRLRGVAKHSTFTTRVYYSFQGIPYGKPPLGDLRFKAPEPFGGWEGVRDALTEGNHCCQSKPEYLLKLDPTELMLGSEDCLYLNISVNKLPTQITSKLPVMVFIHGGGFESGTGSFTYCGPDFFMEEDIVLVTINYRCGPFGFLSLETEEVPGNAGLKDQTLALKWIHDNIESFGGDPDNVTIFGTSAGGASVQYHLLSPLSAGLFHKAIMQSGSALNPWALQHEPRHTANLLAATLGCTSSDPEDVLTFLQAVSAKDLIVGKKKMVESKDFGIVLDLTFTPCVETAGMKPFLSDNPQKLMEAGKFHKVPVILGTTVREGSVVALCNHLTDVLIERQQKNPMRLAPLTLNGSVKEEQVQHAISQFYFNGEAVSWDNVDNLITFLSDVIINVGMGESRDALVRGNSRAVYRYLFTNHRHCFCQALKHKWDEPLFSKIFSGSCHSREIMSMFSFQHAGILKLTPLSPEDEEDIRKIVKTWATFASVGDPNHEGMETQWEKDTGDNPCYMDIGSRWHLRRGAPFEDRIKFWNELQSKHQID